MRIIDIPNELLTPKEYLDKNQKINRAYNNAIIEANNNTYMFYRYHPPYGNHNTEIGVVELDRNLMPISTSARKVNLVPHSAKVTTYDDPRVITYRGVVMLTYAHGMLVQTEKGWPWCCSIGIASLPNMYVGKQWLPNYGKNLNLSNVGKNSEVFTEKNWSPFIANDKLMYLYTINPMVALEVDLQTPTDPQHGNRVYQVSETEAKIKHWKWGDFLGGGTPLIYDSATDEFWGIFHSFTNEDPKNRAQRRYHMGYYAITGTKPFKLKRMSKVPIMSAEWDWSKDVRSQQTPWLPNCIYPCGVMERSGMIYISYGWQDCRCQIAEYTRDEIMGKGKVVEFK